MVPQTIAALLILGIVLGGGVRTVSGLCPFSFRYDGGLCRKITPANAAQCCLDDPLPPVGPFPKNLVIGIGPRKTGTTYLYNLLKDHPDIRMPSRDLKELHFFSNRRSVLDRDQPKNGTLEEYMEYWDMTKTPESTVFMEFSSDYFRDPAAPCRMKRMAPNAKILVNLRDPAARALSLTQMLRSHCLRDNKRHTLRINELHPKVCCNVAKPLHCAFDEAKEEMNRIPGCDFQSGVPERNWRECAHREYVHDPVHTGHYAPIIAWWFEFFPPENFLFMRLEEDLKADPLKQANRVLDFMGIERRLEEAPKAQTYSGSYHWADPLVKSTILDMQVYYSKPNTELTMFLDSQGHSLGAMALETPRESEGNIPLPVNCPYTGNFVDFDFEVPKHPILEPLLGPDELMVPNCNISDVGCCDSLRESFYKMTQQFDSRGVWLRTYGFQMLCVIIVAGVYVAWRRPQLLSFQNRKKLKFVS